MQLRRDGIFPACVVRRIDRVSGIKGLVAEVALLAHQSGYNEHAIISTKDGRCFIVEGGTEGMSFPDEIPSKLLLHTHPSPATGPSDADRAMLGLIGQERSWLYEAGKPRTRTLAAHRDVLPLTRFRRS
ncbi:MAG TPA: hypothetical protein VIJ22_16120 [Polyangiaceae bacterium]